MRIWTIACAITVCLLLCASQGTEAQDESGANELRSQISPGGKHCHAAAMAYDQAQGVAVLFGSTADSETWTWDGHSWLLAATEGPSPRYFHAMAYDPNRERVVLFGGEVVGAWHGSMVEKPGSTEGEDHCLGDTWEWNGESWEKKADGGPGRRGRLSLFYDTKRRRIMLYGGSTCGDNSRTMNDMWQWDGTKWSLVAKWEVQASDGPASAEGMGPWADQTMVFDVARSRGVAVAGGGKETWEWDSAGWTRMATNGPTREGFSMVYDAARKRVLRYGGAHGRHYSDLWAWDGEEWEKLSECGPLPRWSAAMSYDQSRQTVVLYGGSTQSERGWIVPLDSTWEWDDRTWTIRQGQEYEELVRAKHKPKSDVPPCLDSRQQQSLDLQELERRSQ